MSKRKQQAFMMHSNCELLTMLRVQTTGLHRESLGWAINLFVTGERQKTRSLMLLNPRNEKSSASAHMTTLSLTSTTGYKTFVRAVSGWHEIPSGWRRCSWRKKRSTASTVLHSRHPLAGAIVSWAATTWSFAREPTLHRSSLPMWMTRWCRSTSLWFDITNSSTSSLARSATWTRHRCSLTCQAAPPWTPSARRRSPWEHQGLRGHTSQWFLPAWLTARSFSQWLCLSVRQCPRILFRLDC